MSMSMALVRAVLPALALALIVRRAAWPVLVGGVGAALWFGRGDVARVWAMQGLIWVGLEIGPLAVAAIAGWLARRQAARVWSARRRYEEEWGIPPRG